ncbi:MAG: PhzF family phenazine biosynthesis protein [Cyanobacteria bacterium K_Offshore_surface_m2_239]|nr:PhzF family phenazine biosynthesis protein [Cyanobacteria bacterium K_Offshore_surface_m2_239]
MRAGGLPAVLVEAFSEGPLGGNGATVILLGDAAPASWMQRVAGSLKQSETAFLLPRPEGTWSLRWFTPRREVPLCGHATLAALLALAHWGQLSPGASTRFHTRSGSLTVRLLAPPVSGIDTAPRGQLDLPRFPLRPLAAEASGELLPWLSEWHGVTPEACWQSDLGYHVVLLPSSAPLAQLREVAHGLPEPSRDGLVLMQALPPSGTPEARVAGEPADYQLRFFAPGLGLEEDPVTGSAHALVAPYWLERLQRARVIGWQCSDRPGGMVCEAGSSGMIRLTGSGHLLWEGTLRVVPEHGFGRGGPSDPVPSPASEEWDEACGP